MQRSLELNDPYGVLGLAPGASQQEIAAAYRKRSLKVHPDRCPDNPSAAAEFDLLTRARNLLLDLAKSRGGTGSGTQRAAAAAGFGPGEQAGGSSTVFSPSPATVVASEPVAPKRSGAQWTVICGQTTQKSARCVQQESSVEPRAAPAFTISAAVSTAAAAAAKTEEASLGPQLKKRAQAKRRGPARARDRGGVSKGGRGKLAAGRRGRRDGGGSGSTKVGHSKEEEQDVMGAEEEAEELLEEAFDEDDDHEMGAGNCEAAEEEEEDEEEREEGEQVEEDKNHAQDLDVEAVLAGLDVEVEVLADAVARMGEDGTDEEVDCNGGDLADGEDQVDLANGAALIRGITNALVDWAFDVPGVPLTARKMLADMCRSLGAAAFHRCSPQAKRGNKRHRYEDQVLAMLGETLSKASAVLTREFTEAAGILQAVENDEEQVAKVKTDIETAFASLKAKRAEADTRRADIARHEKELAMAWKEVASAKAQARKDAKEATACAEAKNSAEKTVSVFSALESDGGSARPAAELRAELRLVEVLMRTAGVAQSLMAGAERAVLPALRCPPKKRSRFDEAALSACEGCLREHCQEQVARAVASDQRRRAAEEVVCRRRARVAAIQGCATEAAGALQDNIRELQECKRVLAAAVHAGTLRTAELKRLRLATGRKRCQMTRLEGLLVALQKI